MHLAFTAASDAICSLPFGAAHEELRVTNATTVASSCHEQEDVWAQVKMNRREHMNTAGNLPLLVSPLKEICIDDPSELNTADDNSGGAKGEEEGRTLSSKYSELEFCPYCKEKSDDAGPVNFTVTM